MAAPAAPERSPAPAEPRTPRPPLAATAHAPPRLQPGPHRGKPHPSRAIRDDSGSTLINFPLPWHCGEALALQRRYDGLAANYIDVTGNFRMVSTARLGPVYLGNVQARKGNCHSTSSQLLKRQQRSGVTHKDPCQRTGCFL